MLSGGGGKEAGCEGGGFGCVGGSGKGGGGHKVEPKEIFSHLL